MARILGRHGEVRNVYKMLVEKNEGRRQLGRSSRRWEENIKLDVREIGYDGLY
jgi:hypothetical protein